MEESDLHTNNNYKIEHDLCHWRKWSWCLPEKGKSCLWGWSICCFFQPQLLEVEWHLSLFLSLSRRLEGERKQHGREMGDELTSPSNLFFLAEWNMMTVKTVKGKGRSQRQKGLLTVPASFWDPVDSRAMRYTVTQSYLMLRVVLLMGMASTAVGMKSKENAPTTTDVNKDLTWPARIVSQTPTSCCLILMLVLSLSNILKRIWLSNKCLLFLSRKEMWVWALQEPTICGKAYFLHHTWKLMS